MQGDIAQILRAAVAAGGQRSSDFDLNPGIAQPKGRLFRPAGVLVAVQNGTLGAEVVLTKRASHLKHHPGQIAFAGGKQDPGDADPTAAALREAHEEIGLNPALVEVMGQLSPHETVTGFLVTPVLGYITAPFTPVPEAGEVDEVFSVPLSHLLVRDNYWVEKRLWRGAWRHFHVVPYGPYYIWGATARILHALADRMVECG